MDEPKPPVMQFLGFVIAAVLSSGGVNIYWRESEWYQYLIWITYAFLFVAVIYAAMIPARMWVETYERVTYCQISKITAMSQVREVAPLVAEMEQAIPGVSNDFLRSFLGDCSATGLTPINTYSDGSSQRDMAKVITNDFIRRGWVSEAAGNKPAQWKNGWGAGLAGRALDVNVSAKTSTYTTSPTAESV